MMATPNGTTTEPRLNRPVVSLSVPNTVQARKLEHHYPQTLKANHPKSMFQLSGIHYTA